MLPLIASMLGRAAVSAGAREFTGAAVGAAARSGAISAGTSSAASGGRVLSTMQFGSAAARAVSHGGNDTSHSAPVPAPAATEQTGWARA